MEEVLTDARGSIEVSNLNSSRLSIPVIKKLDTEYSENLKAALYIGWASQHIPLARDTLLRCVPLKNGMRGASQTRVD